MCILVLRSSRPTWLNTTHREEEGGDGGAAVDVDHGQEAGQVALSGAGEEQPGRRERGARKHPICQRSGSGVSARAVVYFPKRKYGDVG